MKTTRLTVLGITGALLLGSAVVQAEETDTSVDQRNQVWSMQGEKDGSYTDAPLQTREQKRIRAQAQTQTRTRTRAHAYGDGQGSRYGQGYESRGGYGPGAGGSSPGAGRSGAGAGGAGRSGGSGGGRR